MGLDIYGNANHKKVDESSEDSVKYYFWGNEWADHESGAPAYRHESENVAGTGMSYRGYLKFRQVLASTYLGVTISVDAAGVKWSEPADTDDALWKLICYADNEGVFGPPMVKRVAKRLAELDRDLLPEGWRDALDRWREVFEETAKYEDGCVQWA